MKKSMLLKLDANNAKEPITPNISHSKKKENPRRSLLHAIWWTFLRRGYRAAVLGFYQRNNVNPSYQERRQSMEDTLSKFMSESTKRHEENSNLIKEIQASTDTAIRNQGASIITLEIQIGKMSKVLQERGFKSLPRSTEANPRDQVKSISTTIEVDSYLIRRIRSSQYAVSAGQKRLTVKLADMTVKYLKGIAKNVLVGIGKFVFLVDFVILDMPEDIKVPLILGRPFLSTARAKIDVFKQKITLRIGEERIIFKSVKPASSLIKRVYMLSLRERMELDLEARLMGETLLWRKSKVMILMPTIEEGEVIEEFRTRDDELNTEINDYPSYCDYDKKIHIDYAHNLKFSCMIGFEFTQVNFFPLLYVNVMSKKFHNFIMKDKMVYKGNNVIGVLMNVPIFVGTLSVMTDFIVLEDMDAYRDEGIGGVIFGEPFLREVEIKTREFEGMIAIYNGNDEVTYQMVQSHPRFKHHTNEQCNKILPLLKVSDEDKNNGISHPYFYKGVLNLGPDYIRDARTKE
ncbi:putative reverse transcriptase domain-containing protein [Tanacetum coccineum]|uniref:Reverse transcriptase domain-containing protein n=1 Tax=Tanacetum coccineum TaxID=301880 RepID=A0ABQ4ZWL2_9ASTR